MTLSQEWIDHSPNLPHKCGGETRRTAVGETCECGMPEQHTHCDGCGRVRSIGSGDVIKEWTIPKSKLPEDCR